MCVPEKNMKKKVKWIVLGVLGIIVIAIVVLFMNLNSIVRRTVESQSTAQLKVPTTLGGVSLSILGGDVSLRNFDVGSPEGYKAPQMLSLGGLDVDTSWSGIRSDPVKVDSIAIDKPRMVLEMKGREFNIKKFVDGLPKSDEPQAPAGGEKPLKLLIGKLTVNGAQVVLRPDAGALSGFPGLADKLKPEYVLNIPKIEMNDIGTAEGNQNGAAVKDVVTMLLTTLADKASESKDLPEEVRGLLKGDLSSAMTALKEKGMAEAQKQIGKYSEELKAKIGSELGDKAADALNNPDLKKDPGKAVENILGGFGGKKEPTTKP
jgi:hypothetical protein